MQFSSDALAAIHLRVVKVTLAVIFVTSTVRIRTPSVLDSSATCFLQVELYPVQQ